MEGSAPDVTTAPELDWRPKVYDHGTYRMNQLLQVTGGQTVDLAYNTNASITSRFEIPAKVFNPSKSVLNFRLDQLGINQTGGAVQQALKCLHAQGLPMIERMALFTRSGVYISDLYSFGEYTNLIAPYTTSKEQLLNTPYARPETFKEADPGAANVPNYVSPFTDSSDPVTDLLSPSLVTPYLTTVGADACQQVTGSIRESGNVRNERAYPITDDERWRYKLETFPYPAGGGAGGAADGSHTISQRYQIELGKIPNSIYAINRDIFFGDVVILEITWAGADKILHSQLVADRAPVALPNITLRVVDLALYLAVEVNPSVFPAIIRQVQSNGLRFTVPYVYPNRYTSPSGDKVSVQVRLNRGHGKTLLKVYTGIYKPISLSANRSLAYSHGSTVSVLSDATVVAPVSRTRKYVCWDYIYTMLDNERLQEINMTTQDGRDYMYMKDLIRGSAGEGYGAFTQNWCWMDSWTGMPSHMANLAAFTEGGLNLDQERLYTFFVQINALAYAAQAPFNGADFGGLANPIIYQFFVTQKTLTITPTQISIV